MICFFNQALPYAYNHKRSQFGFPEYVSAALRAETVIGQGETMITPLHNLIITSAIANGGLIVEPYLVDYIENPNGKIVEQTLPNGYETTLTVDEIKALREYMVATVTMGTGKNCVVTTIALQVRLGLQRILLERHMHGLLDLHPHKSHK